MRKGEVKWYDKNKGYGFIKPEEGVGDVFVHSADITEENVKVLEAGDRVEFEMLETPHGPRAVNVRKVERLPVHP